MPKHCALSNQRIIKENSLTTKKVPRERRNHGKSRMVTFGSIIPRGSIKLKMFRAYNEKTIQEVILLLISEIIWHRKRDRSQEKLKLQCYFAQTRFKISKRNNNIIIITSLCTIYGLDCALGNFGETRVPSGGTIGNSATPSKSETETMEMPVMPVPLPDTGTFRSYIRMYPLSGRRVFTLIYPASCLTYRAT